MSRVDELFTPPPRGDDGPVFDAPWQAEVLGIAEALVLAGRFSRRDWSETLGACLLKAQASGQPDEPCVYYEAALAALERLLDRNGDAAAEEVEKRCDLWRRAYENTPHGKPVMLGAARKG